MELTQNTLETCRTTMNSAAKSFSFASHLFDSDAMAGAQLLYGWCRYCDDQVDEAPDQREAKSRLHQLEVETKKALKNHDSQQSDYFKALSYLSKTYNIPEYYALELLAGMKMDVENFEYKTEKDLDLYCFRVAGVVGLMMTHIMGLSKVDALDEAVAAGMAMQLTNISRDIVEDYENGRIYLPKAWFEEANLNYPPLSKDDLIQSATVLAPKLINRAEKFYTKGKQGLVHLPFRAALAISAAIDIYSAIGHKVLRRGEHAWDTRTYIPKWQKVFLATKGILRVFGQIPKRIFRPWKSQPINKTWRFQ